MTCKSWIRIAAAALLLLPVLSLAATIGVLTIADGEVNVLRDTRRLGAGEGLRLRADDIVRTAAGAQLARVELDDGTIVDLGPATQLLLQPRAGAEAARPATLYLLQGWAKLTVPAKASEAASLSTPRLAATGITGTALVRAGSELAWLFVEAGAATVASRGDAPARPAQALGEGDSYTQRGAEAGLAGRRAPADLRTQMPRALADSLPRRAPRFAALATEPTSTTEVGYDEVAPWLNGEAALRAGFVPRFTPLAKQARFRSGLVAELSLHQEWRRVLFPPPPPPPPRPKERAVAVLRAPAAAVNPVPAETKPAQFLRWVPVEEATEAAAAVAPGSPRKEADAVAEPSLSPAQEATRGDPQ